MKYKAAGNVIRTDGVYINGRWEPGEYVGSVASPIDGTIYGYAHFAGAQQLNMACVAAKRALTGDWSRWTPEDRAAALRRLSDQYMERQGDLSQVILTEVGSPLAFCNGPQITHPLRIINYYAAAAEKRRFCETRDGTVGALSTVVHHVPVGAVGIITPWNMPQKTILMKAAPALAAGCTVVIKPAEETPFDAMMLARMFDAAGFPPGVVNVVPASRADSELLPVNPNLDKIAFTGSTKVGRYIAQACARDIRRYSLELGGKSATILCPDADLDAWQETFLDASMLNNGQICSNQTRILVHRDQHDDVLNRIAAVLEKTVVGDPRDPDTHIGPLITPVAAANYRRHLNQAAQDRANVTWAKAPGRDLPAAGNYVIPAIVHDLPSRELDIVDTEVFGPAVVVLPYVDEIDAVRTANLSRYGLHAGVWSASKQTAQRIAKQLRVGQIQINGAPMPLHTPLGGFKESGWGRELGPEGLEHYLETVAVASPW